MQRVTIQFSGPTGSGKTRLHRLFLNELRRRGFNVVDWDTETDDGDYLVVDTSDTYAMVEGTTIDEAAE